MATNTSNNYQAWQVSQQEDGSFVGKETTLSTEHLPLFKNVPKEDHCLIRVTHSSLNYKDALSASGNQGVTRSFPHAPGIDAVGFDADNNKPCLITGYDLGMNTPGGFGEYIQIPKAWLVNNPFDPPELAMVYGTAGLTAGLCVAKLLQLNAKPEDGTVVVTGASGAVGSVAVEILAKLGFDVTAISSKEANYLQELGAKEVLPRDTLATATSKPMLKPIWAHAIDTVGGPPLAELIKQIRPGGSIACCGMVAGYDLPNMTVLPFILRGIHLLGVDSVEISVAQKIKVWQQLAGPWRCPQTEAKAKFIGRHELDAHLKAFLKGESQGKIVLDHSLTKPTNAATTQSSL